MMTDRQAALSVHWGMRHWPAGYAKPGRHIEGDAHHTADERTQFGAAATALGEDLIDLPVRLGAQFDVWLNDVACWQNVPQAVWESRICGHRVISLSLTPTTQAIPGSNLTPDPEVTRSTPTELVFRIRQDG